MQATVNIEALSEAKQSKAAEIRKFTGLLRRYAPQRFYVDRECA